MTESSCEIIIAENHTPDKIELLKADRSIFAVSLSGIELKPEAQDPADFLDELTIAHGFAERLLAKKWVRTAIFHKGEEEYWKQVALQQSELNDHNRRVMYMREGGFSLLLFGTLIFTYAFWFQVWGFAAFGALLTIFSFILFNQHKFRSSLHE